MSPIDAAAKAANDTTNANPDTMTVGEHLERSMAQAKPPKTPKGKRTKDAPALKVDTEDSLRHELAVVKQQLVYFKNRRERELMLLANRDAALASIEAAKNRLSSEKSDLAAIDESIATMLRQPEPTNWEDTPIGRAINGSKEAAPAMPWKQVLPDVSEDRMRLLGDDAKGELPTVEALCAAVLDPKAMEGKKRSVAQTVTVYGAAWMVTHLWKDAETGACRANVVALMSRDEWTTKWEAKYGRAVKDFDQTKESMAQRKTGGPFCGLTVKAGQRALIVGPQETALHLAYLPPETAKEPEEVVLPTEPDGGLNPSTLPPDHVHGRSKKSKKAKAVK